MSATRDGSALLGALLDRLGTTQAQALLTRLDQWLASTARRDTKGLDHDQVRAVQGPYDRRRQDRNGNSHSTVKFGVDDAKG
jgi:hypothetical protein